VRDISLKQTPTQLPHHTFLLYGDTRSGKTQFGATFPRPLILADVTEGGYHTIAEMDPALWFEPDVEPIVWGIENMNDMSIARDRAAPLIANGTIMSIVVDAFSFYTDFYLNFIIGMQTKPDNRSAYGDLGKHLRDLRVQWHRLGASVAWNCLAKHPDSDDPKGRPLIPGQQADKFSAGVDFLFYLRLEQIKQNGKVVQENFNVHTRQYGQYIAGNRLGQRADQLPDPFMGTYADLLQYIGYDLAAVRAAMPKRPKYTPIAAGSTAVVKAPPVTQQKTTYVINKNPAPKVAPTPPQAK
jgi:hypothetical protein